jgi:hypothetical protein
MSGLNSSDSIDVEIGRRMARMEDFPLSVDIHKRILVINPKMHVWNRVGIINKNK